MTIITSPSNSSLKLVRRLQRRRARAQEGAFVAEGEDLVQAGLDRGHHPRVVLVDAARPLDLDGLSGPRHAVASELLAAVSELGHAPRVIGVFDQIPCVTVEPRSAPWIVLDGVRDPGNVGTVIRTVGALGGAGVALTSGCADPYSHKAVRASMGAIFDVPLARIDDVASLRQVGLRIIALDAHGDQELTRAEVSAGAALVIGAERTGLTPSARRDADVVASIPLVPEAESLNAGVAAAIGLWEWRRSFS